MKYIGFGGEGHQVRDCMHPRDLVPVILAQLGGSAGQRICNFGGGRANSMSLRQLSNWCAERFGVHEVASTKEERPFDLPWLVLDSTRAEANWNWRQELSLNDILEEIATHAERHPNWLDLTS